MKSFVAVFSSACCAGALGLIVLLDSGLPASAGLPVPAPLIGVTGPVGILAAGVAFGAYLLCKRYLRQD